MPTCLLLPSAWIGMISTSEAGTDPRQIFKENFLQETGWEGGDMTLFHLQTPAALLFFMDGTKAYF